MSVAIRRHKIPLSEKHQEALERLIRARGDLGAAVELGVGIGVVHQLAGGGLAIPSTVARVAAALDEATACAQRAR